MKEIIDVILYVIVIFIMCLVGYNICYGKLNNYKFKFNIKNLLLTFTATILALLNAYINPVPIKVILNLFIFSLELKLIFNDNFKKTVINYIFFYLLMSLIEMFLTKFLFFVEIINNNDSANTLTYFNLTLTIVVGSVVYLLVSIKPIRRIFRKIINFFMENKIITNIIYLIFITIAVLSMIYIENFSETNTFRLILMLYFIFTILFILVIKSRFNEEMLKISNKKLIDYNNNYGKFLDEYKIYKHNINHKLSNIKSYGNKKVNALIDDLLGEETTFSIRNNEIYKVPNGIKGIVAEKLYNNKFNIIIDNKIKDDPFSKLSPKVFNSVSESLGIVLDNALEASEQTKDPIIVMDLYEDENSVYLKIGNNFCNDIDLDELGDKYYSTKNRGSGLGLFSITQNKLVKEQISIINNFYYIELQIKKAR